MLAAMNVDLAGPDDRACSFCGADKSITDDGFTDAAATARASGRVAFLKGLPKAWRGAAAVSSTLNFEVEGGRDAL